MDDLLKKLNVLLKATLNDILSDSRSSDSETAQPSTVLSGRGADKQIATLRQRINETLAFEDEIQKRIQALQAEVDRWNQAADDALASGKDAVARHAVDQMNRAQQSLTMAQSDLHEHQKVTEELILHVNVLEAAMESARSRQPDSAQPSTEPPVSSIGQVVSNTLQEMRDKINQISNQIVSRSELPEESADQPADDGKIDDDLEQRRQRLSKPK
jgi:phage shock protein A